MVRTSDNTVSRPGFRVNMATLFQVKVEYGEKCFCTFLIKNIKIEKLFDEINRNCSQLAHLPNSRIRVTYRDDDGDMVNLIPNDDFFFEVQGI